MDQSDWFEFTFAAVRAVHLAACLVLAGVWAFDRLIVAPTLPLAGATLRKSVWNPIAARLLLLSIPLAAVSAAGWFVLVAMNMSELPLSQAVQPDVMKLVGLHTQFGPVWILHGALLIVAAAGAVVWRKTRGGRWRTALAWSNWIVTAGASAGIAWAGHGATGPAPVAHRLADVLHLLISSVWPVGLLPLALILLSLCNPSRRIPGWASHASRLTRRFSSWSLSSVLLLTATGLVNSACLVSSTAALWGARYGQVLVMKLLLVTTMIILGATNRIRLLPRFEAGMLVANSTAGEAALRPLLWSIVLEVGLSGAVIAAVGILGMLPPAR